MKAEIEAIAKAKAVAMDTLSYENVTGHFEHTSQQLQAAQVMALFNLADAVRDAFR